MSAINLNRVVKRYGALEVVKGIDLAIESDEFVALVGPSGCGKTTTLRMIAGLEDISSGEIHIGGALVNDIAPKNRNIAMVFQSYALYPHMTVFDNIAFGMRLRSVGKEEIRQSITDVARMLEINELLDRKPRNLSGGQRQRVAMARAIVRKPSVFLFDEPLSNLDAQLRVHMRTELKRLRSSVRTTTVYVTHDQVEAMTLADRIVVMNKGVIEQVGRPSELYASPRSRFVAGFIGSPAMNFLNCRLESRSGALVLVLEDGQLLPVPEERSGRYGGWVDRNMVVGIRPEHLGYKQADMGAGFGTIRATLDVVEPLGSETLVFCRVGQKEVCGKAHPSLQLRPGVVIELSADMSGMHLFDPTTDHVV